MYSGSPATVSLIIIALACIALLHIEHEILLSLTKPIAAVGSNETDISKPFVCFCHKIFPCSCGRIVTSKLLAEVFTGLVGRLMELLDQHPPMVLAFSSSFWSPRRWIGFGVSGCLDVLCYWLGFGPPILESAIF